MKKTPEERYQAIADAVAVIRNDPAAYRAYVQDELDRMTYETDLHFARQEGKAEGALEKSLETARKLKAENLAVDMISRITGLSTAEIAAL